MTTISRVLRSRLGTATLTATLYAAIATWFCAPVFEVPHGVGTVDD